jgi:hypothetical protein
MSVQVLVNVPNEVINAVTEDASRRIVEQFALEGFKSGQLTTTQVRRLLGFESRLQVYDFLAAHGVAWVDYSDEEIERERELLKRIVPE